MKNRLLKIFLLLPLVLFFAVLPAFAQKLNVPVGGIEDIPSDPVQYINALYRYSIGFGVLLAVLFIVFGGVMYITSSGFPSNQAKGKEIIFSAVFGVVLLLIATTLIYTLLGRKSLEPQKDSEVVALQGGVGSRWKDQVRYAIDFLENEKKNGKNPDAFKFASEALDIASNRTLSLEERRSALRALESFVIAKAPPFENEAVGIYAMRAVLGSLREVYPGDSEYRELVGALSGRDYFDPISVNGQQYHLRNLVDFYQR